MNAIGCWKEREEQYRPKSFFRCHPPCLPSCHNSLSLGPIQFHVLRRSYTWTSSLVGGDEGCVGPSGKRRLSLWQAEKISRLCIHVWLLGISVRSPHSTKRAATLGTCLWSPPPKKKYISWTISDRGRNFYLSLSLNLSSLDQVWLTDTCFIQRFIFVSVYVESTPTTFLPSTLTTE